MMKFKLLGAAVALSISSVAFAADAGCCADMACCKDGADCCKDGKSADCCHDKAGSSAGHTGHDMPGMKH